MNAILEEYLCANECHSARMSVVQWLSATILIIVRHVYRTMSANMIVSVNSAMASSPTYWWWNYFNANTWAFCSTNGDLASVRWNIASSSSGTVTVALLPPSYTWPVL